MVNCLELGATDKPAGRPWGHCGHQHRFAFGETEAGAAPALLGVMGMSQGASSSVLGRAVPSALSRLSQQKAGGKKQTETNLSKLPVSQLPGCEAAALPPGKTAQRPGTRCGASGGWGARGSEAPGDPAAPSQGVTRKGGAGGAGTRAAPPPPPPPRTTTPGEPCARVTRPRRDELSGARLDRVWLSRTGTGPAPPPCR